MNTLLFNFICNGRTDKIKRSVFSQDYSLGGYKMVDFTNIVQSAKCMWIKKYLCQDSKDWHYTFQSFCSKNNLALFLRSNYTTDELPSSVPDYYIDSVKAWREVKYDEVTSSEDLHNQFIWFNRHILIDGKTL